MRSSQSDGEMYRLIVNEINDGILVLDAGFRLRFSNPAMLRILGYAQEELDGVWAGDLVWPAPQDQARYAEETEKRRRGESCVFRSFVTGQSSST